MNGTLFAAIVASTLGASAPGLQVAPDASPLDPPGGPPMTLAAGVDPVARMTVGVFVNDRGPFRFVVDTGATRTVLSRALAERLALPAGKRAEVHDIAGVDGLATALVQRLRIGKRQIDNIVAPLLSAEDMGADGILGIDGLVDQQVVMDFPSETMSISPVRKSPAESDVIVVRARRRFGQLILADARVDGERVYVIIDSGAQYSIGNSALRDRLMRGRRRPATIPVTLIGVTGRTMTADYAVTPRMRIGSILVRNVPIAFSDIHPFRQFGLSGQPAMLLGMDLLRGFERVSLDFEQKRVRFQLKGQD